MAREMRVVGGVEFEVISWGTGLVTFSAEITEAQHAERAEVWAGLRTRGWEVEPVTHAIDPEIVDAGKVYLILRCKPEEKPLVVSAPTIEERAARFGRLEETPDGALVLHRPVQN